MSQHEPENTVYNRIRCFAAGEEATHHPQMGYVKLQFVHVSERTCNEQLRLLLFTQVNACLCSEK